MEANLQDKPVLLHLRPSLELRQPNYFTTRRRHRRGAATAVAACLDLLVMYSAQPTGADGATINPAALNSDIFSAPPRGIKRNRSPDLVDSHRPGDDGMSAKDLV